MALALQGTCRGLHIELVVHHGTEFTGYDEIELM